MNRLHRKSDALYARARACIAHRDCLLLQEACGRLQVPFCRVACVWWLRRMGDLEYVYELRQGEEVVATGRLTRARPLEVGERVTIGGREGIVRAVDPLLGERELRLVVQLVRDPF